MAKTLIWIWAMSRCKESWENGEKGRQLYAIPSQVGGMSFLGNNRKGEKIITTLRIGHAKLNGSLNNEGTSDREM